MPFLLFLITIKLKYIKLTFQICKKYQKLLKSRHFGCALKIILPSIDKSKQYCVLTFASESGINELIMTLWALNGYTPIKKWYLLWRYRVYVFHSNLYTTKLRMKRAKTVWSPSYKIVVLILVAFGGKWTSYITNSSFIPTNNNVFNVFIANCTKTQIVPLINPRRKTHSTPLFSQMAQSIYFSWILKCRQPF